MQVYIIPKWLTALGECYSNVWPDKLSLVRLPFMNDDKDTPSSLPETLPPPDELGVRVRPMVRRGDGSTGPAEPLGKADVIERVLAMVAEGGTLTGACDSAGIPTRTWHRWCARDAAINERYQEALDIGAETMGWSRLDTIRAARAKAEAMGWNSAGSLAIAEAKILDETASRMKAGGITARGEPGQSTSPRLTLNVRFDTPKAIAPPQRDAQSHTVDADFEVLSDYSA